MTSYEKCECYFILKISLLSNNAKELLDYYYKNLDDDAICFLLSSSIITKIGSYFSLSGFETLNGGWDGDDNGVIGYVINYADPEDSFSFNNEIDVYVNNNWQVIRLV